MRLVLLRVTEVLGRRTICRWLLYPTFGEFFFHWNNFCAVDVHGLKQTYQHNDLLQLIQSARPIILGVGICKDLLP